MLNQFKLPEVASRDQRVQQIKNWVGSETDRSSTDCHSPKKVKIPLSVALVAACYAKDKMDFKRILNLGVDINCRNQDGMTCVHQCCINGDCDFLEFLINEGADVNVQDNEGWTPLHAAASIGCIDMVKLLLDHQANPSLFSCEMELPVDVAHDQTVIDVLNENMRTRGIDPAAARQTEEKLLLAHAQHWLDTGEYTPFTDTRTGATPLHVAACKDYVGVMEVLLKIPTIQLDVQDADGWTALHAAAHWNKDRPARLLAEAGASFDVYTYANQSIFDVADREIVVLLRQLREQQRANKKEIPDSVKVIAPVPNSVDSSANGGSPSTAVPAKNLNEQQPEKKDVVDKCLDRGKDSPGDESSEDDNSFVIMPDEQGEKEYDSKSVEKASRNSTSDSTTASTEPSKEPGASIAIRDTQDSLVSVRPEVILVSSSADSGKSELLKVSEPSGSVHPSSHPTPLIHTLSLGSLNGDKANHVKAHLSPASEIIENGPSSVSAATLPSTAATSAAAAAASSANCTTDGRKLLDQPSPGVSDRRGPGSGLRLHRQPDPLPSLFQLSEQQTPPVADDKKVTAPVDKSVRRTRTPLSHVVPELPQGSLAVSDDQEQMNPRSAGRRISFVSAVTKTDEAETQRTLKARHVRSTRRSTQGVNAEELEEAKRISGIPSTQSAKSNTSSEKNNNAVSTGTDTLHPTRGENVVIVAGSSQSSDVKGASNESARPWLQRPSVRVSRTSVRQPRSVQSLTVDEPPRASSNNLSGQASDKTVNPSSQSSKGSLRAGSDYRQLNSLSPRGMKWSSLVSTRPLDPEVHLSGDAENKSRENPSYPVGGIAGSSASKSQSSNSSNTAAIVIPRPSTRLLNSSEQQVNQSSVKFPFSRISGTTTSLPKPKSISSALISKVIPPVTTRYCSGNSLDYGRYQSGVESNIDYRKLYEEEKANKELLSLQLEQLKREIARLRIDLNRNNQEAGQLNSRTASPASTSNSTDTLSSIENELTRLREENSIMREENGALIRVISKLSRPG